MGAHHGSIHILTDNLSEVKVALELLFSDTQIKFLIGPLTRGWVVVFPEQYGQDLNVSKQLAHKIHRPLLHCLVHDDDLFTYHYFENGDLVDQYNSCPEYFGEKLSSRGGEVASLHAILPRKIDQEKLNTLLKEPPFTFETERFERLATILSLPYAVTAYESLQAGERQGITNWKKFLHIPDPSLDRIAKRVANIQAKAEIKRLLREGILIFEQIPKQIKDQWWRCNWCINSTTGKILLAWSDRAFSETTLIQIDPKTGIETPTSIKLSNTISTIAISPDGQWLAAGYASGDWKTALIHLESGQQIEFTQKRAVTAVCFSPNGKTFFSASENVITIARGSKWRDCETIQLADYCRRLAVHPQGEYLVAEVRGTLVIIHIPTAIVTKTLWIEACQGPRHDLMESLQTAIAARLLSPEIVAIRSLQSSQHSSEDTELHSRRLQINLLPKQSVSIIVFGPDGQTLICGTDEGLCVVEWESVCHAGNMTPLIPTVFVESEPSHPDEDGNISQFKYIYSIFIDPTDGRVFFAGGDQKIRFLDPKTLETGALLDLPISRASTKLELTPDRKFLVITSIIQTTRSQKKKPPAFQIWNYPALRN